MTDTKPTPGALPQAWRRDEEGRRHPWRHGTDCADELEAALVDVVQKVDELLDEMKSDTGERYYVKRLEAIRAALSPPTAEAPGT